MFKVMVEKKSFDIEVIDTNHFVVNGLPMSWDIKKIRDHHYHILFNNKSFNGEIVSIDSDTKTLVIKINGHPYPITLKDEFDLVLEKMGINSNTSSQINSIKAPMPGLILDIRVQEGDSIKTGDTLIVLEAMKMENIIKSPREAVIKSITVKKGQSVEKNQILIEF